MSDRVLIADADGARARGVAEACRALGMHVRWVAHGAAALEASLAERSDALLAQLSLPLIGGERLAEILHTNPRTCAMGVLFLGEGDDAAEPGRGRVVPGDADPETIARFLQVLLQKRRTEPPPPGEAGAAPGVEGKLSQLALSELIELFHLNRKTGVIELFQGEGSRTATGRIQLLDGDVVGARCGGVEGEKALYRLLGWRRGDFAFHEQAAVERGGIDRPTRALLSEARRQSEEWERLGADLPAPHARVTLKVARSSLPNVLHPLTQEVLLVLELSDTVQDVLDRSSFPDYQILRTLQSLIRREMVALCVEPPPATAQAGGLFSPSLAARLRDWLEQGRPRDAPSRDAKVVVMASGPEARQTFAALLARLPGVSHAPPRAVDGVWPALRIRVDDEVSLELLDVPADARFAPIWPLAAHGALAALFVHAGGVESSTDALRLAVDEIGALPHVRRFHLLLDEKDGGGVEVLCERLSLFDDHCVLSLSPECPEQAPAVLRELLARLLP